MPNAGRKRRRAGRVTPRVKVWLEVDGQYVFGRGISDILKAIAETGSIKAAAGELAAFDPQVVVAPADAFPHDLIGDGRVVIVRPDRYVAAVSDDIATAAARLAEIGGAQSLPEG